MTKPTKSPAQFRCDVCGRFIPLKDFEQGKAIRKLVTPNSDYSIEDFETLCKYHRTQTRPSEEVKSPAQSLTFDDALSIAIGCHDYSGGHHSEEHYEAFHHGIQTVINCLNAAKEHGFNDTQVTTVWRIGGCGTKR